MIEKWKHAVNVEMETLEKNKAWELVRLSLVEGTKHGWWPKGIPKLMEFFTKKPWQ